MPVGPAVPVGPCLLAVRVCQCMLDPRAYICVGLRACERMRAPVLGSAWKQVRQAVLCLGWYRLLLLLLPLISHVHFPHFAAIAKPALDGAASARVIWARHVQLSSKVAADSLQAMCCVGAAL